MIAIPNINVLDYTVKGEGLSLIFPLQLQVIAHKVYFPLLIVVKLELYVMIYLMIYLHM